MVKITRLVPNPGTAASAPLADILPMGCMSVMMIELDERSAWNSAKCLALIGPGGAGKSSLGIELAPLLERSLIDLDIEFNRRMGDISAYIHNNGHGKYKLANSNLARNIVDEMVAPSVLVTSSGFLTLDNPPQALDANRRLVASSYSVCLLPSRDLERAVSIILERQLARPFSGGPTKEEARIRDRYPIYAGLGDLIVFSITSSAEIARAVTRQLSEN